MNSNPTSSLPLLCMAVCIIGLCELIAFYLNPSFGAIVITLVLRFVQIILLLILLKVTPGGCNFAGLSKNNAVPGIKTGIRWSIYFGLFVCIIGGILALAGRNPIDLFHFNVPENQVFLFLITATIISPIAEELFFRGILYSFLRPAGIIFAVVITTAVFALSHFPGTSIPFIQIIGGIVFALCFEKSKSLFSPIIIHALGNMAIYASVLIF